MKWKVMLAALFFAAVVSAGSQSVKIRVASYNIQSFKTIKSVTSPQTTIEAAKKLNADLIGFQEVRRYDTDPADYFAEMGRVCGGESFFAQTLQRKNFVYGIGIVSRLPARVVKELWLPMQGNLEPRKALFVEVELDGKKIYFITTHMSYEDPTGQLQKTQLEAILNTAEKEGFLPAILTGDLNSTPESPAIQLLRSRWFMTGETPLTFPADKPDRRIDYIAVSDPQKIRLVAAQVIDDGESSDHRPVIAEFEVGF